MNWKEQIKNLAYYGVGYGILLVPAYRFCTSSQQIINYASVLNVIMLLGVFELTLRFMKRLCKGKYSIGAIYICGLFSTLYINNLVQIQMNWTEILNLFLYWLVLNIMMDLLEKNNTKSYILLSIFLCYMVIVHLRNVGIVVAAVMTFFVHLINMRKMKTSQLVSFIIIALVGIVLFFYSKELMKSLVWSDSITAKVNDVGSSVQIVRKAISLNEIPILIESILCKFFYAIVSTYGVAVWGLIFACKKIFKKIEIQKKN